MSLQFNPFTGTFDVTTKGDTGAVAAAGDGSAAAPGITFASDTNTGIYSPGADQLALSTNGTGRLFVDASGNVGLGTATSLNAFTLSRADNTGAIELRIDNTGSSYQSSLRFTGKDAGGLYPVVALIQGYQATNADSGELRFSTKPTGGSATERLRITSAGLVGIGTGSPGANLDLVDGGTFSGIRVANLTTDATTKVGHFTGRHYTNAEESVLGLRITSDSSANSVILGGGSGVLNAATNIQFYTAANSTTTVGTQRMIIDSSGRVGIGTTSPGELLDISPSTEAGAILLGRIPYATHGSFLVGNGLLANHVTKAGNSTVNVSSCKIDFANGPIIFSTSPGAAAGVARTYTETVRIDSSGRLGIGTQSPAASLHVLTSSTTPAQIESSGAKSQILFRDSGTGANYPLIGSDNSALILRGGNSNAENARITSSGQLLVGTNSTSSVNRLIVQSSSDAPTGAGTLLIARGDNAPLTTNVLGALRFGGSTHVNSAEISAFRDGGTWTAGSSLPTGLTFSTTSDASASPTERLRITSAGVLQVADAGNIAVGTTTGTKIGTATTQKLGFFNKTPVVQPAAVADATDAASVITQLNALLARMRDLGLIAT